MQKTWLLTLTVVLRVTGWNCYPQSFTICPTIYCWGFELQTLVLLQVFWIGWNWESCNSHCLPSACAAQHMPSPPSLFLLCLCFGPHCTSSVFVSHYINSVVVMSGMCINSDLPYSCLPLSPFSLSPPPVCFLIHPCLLVPPPPLLSPLLSVSTPDP